ncbi:MAG TPA: DEAD/DEAH box helicase, partial [Bdellovibrionota bacterium]|nr:DEAD/DEAH box helicase [Bdellovibrionota bacterium]
SCPAHRVYETHCKHVAALAIWITERGSLLRSGVGNADQGVADRVRPVILKDPEFARQDVRLRMLINSHPFLSKSRFMIRRDQAAGSLEGRDPDGREFSIPITLVEIMALREYTVEPSEPVRAIIIPAEPVAYVRGMFQGKVLSGLTVEPAARYVDPDNQEVKVDTFSYLQRQNDPNTYRTPDNRLLYVIDQPVPFVGNITAAKVFHQGPAALEMLGRVLTSEHRGQIVLQQSLQLEVDPEPLKLTSMKIGKKIGATRSLAYEFASANAMFTSEELDELSQQGRLSNDFVWKDNRLYKLDMSMNLLAQYANRAGVAQDEGAPDAKAPTGSGTLVDDTEHPLHPLAAYRLSLELGVANLEVDDSWGEFAEWKKAFERKKIPALPKIGYGYDLREYQKNGLSWIWSLYHRGLAALLADDMGLGKTHQVLAFLTSLYGRKTKPTKPALVVAPTSVIVAWQQKLAKYDTKLKWHVYHGKGRKLPGPSTHLVLTTYGILQREEALREKEWHVVILDEAQAIKNATTLSSRASRDLKAQFKIAMTGTPVENQSTDVWSLLEFLLPGYLGSLPRFKRLYGSGREGSSMAQAGALKRLISPFLLRRTKGQVLKELPEKTEEVRNCQMTRAQRQMYRAFLQSAEALKARRDLETGGKVDYANILALLTRLKQVCDHPRLPDLTTGRIKNVKLLEPPDSGKWETFEEILNEALGSGLKLVVFTQYIGVIDMISEYLKGREIDHDELRGDTVDRGARIDRFSKDPNCKVFICSLLAGSLGIDLTAASVCIHFDRWWNPARENQATDRLHRIGQTRGVQVFKLQLDGTVEERIASIIQSKVELSEALIEESSLGLKSFSKKELLGLLTPMDEPTGEDEEEEEAEATAE